MKTSFFFKLFFILPLVLSPQANEWRWQQEVDYSMVIDVDVENHTYKGT